MAIDPHKWITARKILLGEDPERVSVRSAAQAAGITITELQKWVNRSRQKNIEDEPWVHEICEVYDTAKVSQAGTLEDEAWQRALKGTPEAIVQDGEVVGHKAKHDNGLLMKMLKARDERYVDKGVGAAVSVSINQNITIEDLEAKWNAMSRMKEVRDGIIEGDFAQVEDRSLTYQQGESLVDKAKLIDSLFEEIPE